MSKIINSMIRVLDLNQSLKFYADCFGSLPRNAENAAQIAMTWNKGCFESYSHGDSHCHVGVCVLNVAADRVRLTDLGYGPLGLKDFKADDGTLIAHYFFIQKPDSYKVEVLERHGH